MRSISLILVFCCIFSSEHGNCQIVDNYDPTLVDSRLHKLFPKGLNRIIDEIKIFNIYEDSVSNSGLDEYATREVSNIILHKTNIHIDKEFYIIKKYSFIDLPGLHLYIFAGAPSTPKVASFFNSSDSLFYLLSDCVLEYSYLMSCYLKDIIDNEEFYDLILLYLNSLDNFSGYYIVEDIKKFTEIWDNEINKISFIDNSNTLNLIKEQEMNEISNVFKKLEVFQLNYRNSQIYQITLVTWGKKYGTIEEWQFLISDKAIQLKYKKPLFLNKGPWDGLLRRIWD